MKIYLKPYFLLLFLVSDFLSFAQSEEIPLPEHPRPDFMRNEWLNLNGWWKFSFDKADVGESGQWFKNEMGFDKKILVPFPWGSKFSGVENEANIGWYAREIKIPEYWTGKRIFIVFGASDWKTTVWLNGEKLGTHQGGYTPFEFEISAEIIKEGNQHLVVKVDDTPHPFKLEGKQGYGEAKGLWQTVYLETRGTSYIKTLHISPDIDKSEASFHVELDKPMIADSRIKLVFLNGEQSKSGHLFDVSKGKSVADFKVKIENMKLWDLDHPFLYDIEVSLIDNNAETDKVTGYFGMRKISIMQLPGTDYPYIALNNKPVYLQLTLDQSYDPEGFYTFPSDEFMKNEIIRSKQIGLNGNRIHIKVEIPRKLYWADKLGLLIMADVPNSWGEPDSLQQKEWEFTMRAMIKRDFNHPSIFQWVLWNETWGLFSTVDKEKKKREYTKATQEWVRTMYHEVKRIDPTRLVEDNSPCNYDHVETDVNTWHAYLPGYSWKGFLDDAVSKTYKGSEWNFIGGNKQGNQPMFNSECGNVWGYQGSTGDVDWSWDYHIMMNEFRLHPKVCGWLYTEHHDVINEWNGYYKFDRSNKFTGFEEIVPGMTLNDLHSPVYLATSGELCQKAQVNQLIEVPLTASFLTDTDYGKTLNLKTELVLWDNLGNYEKVKESSMDIPFKTWSTDKLPVLKVQMPAKAGLAVLRLVLSDVSGNALHHNFVCFRVQVNAKQVNGNNQKSTSISFTPKSYTSSNWSLGKSEVLNGLKVNGFGSGYFEYQVEIPSKLNTDKVKEINLRLEASARQLFGRDKSEKDKIEGDYMRGKGTFDNSANPNSYPMTDETKNPSRLKIIVNGETIGVFDLEDNPADSRGILSWASQIKNGKLVEAGSYGYLINARIPVELLAKNKDKKMTIRFEVDQSLPGGLAIYGKDFGRYPLDPVLIFDLK
ncbi:MAG: glycoside hydrolase family 2 TIM barrel-domain containing protein [Bacteroidales bacterium]